MHAPFAKFAMHCAADAQRVFAREKNGCGDVKWAEAVADVLPRRPPVTLVNVGANKGYRVPEFLALWSRTRISNLQWQEHLLSYAREHELGFLQKYSCGNCADCRTPLPASHSRKGARVHLLELLPATRALLRSTIAAEKLGGVVTLHELAASNGSGQLAVPQGLSASDERASATIHADGRPDALHAVSRERNLERVRASSLDDFFAAERLRRVYHVAIDTEGWDALVLEGMRGAIARRRVALIEFEVSDRGMWSRASAGAEARSVRGVLEMVGRAGYSCWWLLQNSLIPASGKCFLERPGVVWSNMLCAHEPPLVERLYNLSDRAYERREVARRSRRLRNIALRLAKNGSWHVSGAAHSNMTVVLALM
mmetsp:Transcript_10977/g.23935  ORF Transcript_10977/g.23935 Transcript_10977/m.23935 type:complete len:369 (-) Transcript_10977:189-1295(-)